MTAPDGTGDAIVSPPTERSATPAYLLSYRERRSSDASAPGAGPLSRRRFHGSGPEQATSQASPLVAGDVPRRWADVTRSRELVPEGPDEAVRVATDVYFVRHGETQGYSSESGLTPLGSWQAHRRGQELARGVMSGHAVRLACADTHRARQTAEHLRLGLLDGLAQFGRDAEVGEVTAYPEFQNFGVSTPDGVRDVTAAHRLYVRELERYERRSHGERPGWLVEIDRFWSIQQAGGDPITLWLTMPMIHFEPPVSAVRRFWAGLLRVHAEAPAQSIVVATHSGPIRAFAAWALGYDPGEPVNTEFVRVRLLEGRAAALVLYRNRVQMVEVPDIDSLPDWWRPGGRSERGATTT